MRKRFPDSNQRISWNRIKIRRKGVITFWNLAYTNKSFERIVIVDKTASTVVGTIKLCLHVSNNDFNNMRILIVDVRSDYENSGT